MDQANSLAGEVTSETVPNEVIDKANEREEPAPKEEAKPAEETQDTGEHEDDAKKYSKADINRMFKERDQKRDRSSDRKMDDLQKRIDDLAAKGEAKPEGKTTEDESGQEPSREEYRTYEEYLDARAEYRADKKVAAKLAAWDKQREEETAKGKRQTAEQALDAKGNERIIAGRKEFKDFDNVINRAFQDEVFQKNTELHVGVCESPVGHRIAYYLAQPANHAETDRINALSPRGVQREIGKLELKFAAADTKHKARSDDTMEPLGGGRPSIKKDLNSDDISMEDYAKQKNAAEDKKRRG